MKYFGTDGIRGRAGDFPLVPEFLEKLGKASPGFFQKESNVVLIGGDTRESTSPIMASLSKGVISKGYNVFLAGVIPTPVLAYLTSSIGARCGIIVTASHNPWEDNGVKFFNDNGHKLSEEEEANFEKWMDKEKKPSKHVGKIYPLLDIEEHYLAHLKSIFNLELGKYKIVIDLANGAASELAPFVLKGFGAEPLLLNSEPNGRNINDGCGATCVQGLVSEVKKQKADIGIALDGDGDRCILVDENGRVVDGDAIIAIIALDMHSK
jgi:phosphoglucosamine mutase